MIKKHLRAFTMIELLVVISIIGILSALALVSFAGSQKSARDTARKSDLRQYQDALEIYANKNNGLYPSRTSSSGVSASGTLCTDLAQTTCPEDPKYSDEDPSYIYSYQSNGTNLGVTPADATQYVLWGKLENVTTTTYWVLCSNGKVGKATSGLPPTGGACPL